jgi:hypothetical protein
LSEFFQRDLATMLCVTGAGCSTGTQSLTSPTWSSRWAASVRDARSCWLETGDGEPLFFSSRRPWLRSSTAHAPSEFEQGERQQALVLLALLL